MALGALFVALALFWLSTRQWPTLVRLAVWLVGLALVVTASLWSTPDSFSVRQAIADAWVHRSDLRDAAVVQAFSGNTETVARFVPQLFDFFLIASLLMAALALLAFTRGERLERFLRPTILVLTGFLVGSVATLAVVAIGLGGHVKPRIYLGYIEAADVHDGDTFALGETSFRLFGVEAPELSQFCAGEQNCGGLARDHLASLLQGALVQCNQEVSIRSQRGTESFGRPLVTCLARRDEQIVNVGEQMIEQGFAVRYESDPRYFPGIEEHFRLGCTLRPDIWRRDRTLRTNFENGTAVPREKLIGECATAQP